MPKRPREEENDPAYRRLMKEWGEARNRGPLLSQGSPPQEVLAAGDAFLRMHSAKWAKCPADLPWVPSAWELPHCIFDDDEPGEVWRALPWRKPAEDLLVSNHGYYRVRNCRRRGQYDKKTRGYLGQDGRYYCNNTAVSVLVCEAFRGRKPTPTHSCDHFRPDQKDNNHIDNLWWRTPSQQIRNQRPHAARRDSQPVEVRKKGTDDEWIPYASRKAASRATGVDGHTIRCILRGEDGAGIGSIYEFRVGDPPESQQEVLPPIAKDPWGEERWAFARMRNGEESRTARVSTRGRAQTKTSTGDAWSLIYTPKPNEGQLYAHITIGGVHDKFHTVVYRTFCPDAPIDCANHGSIDHYDQDKTNNALYNLKSATRREQNLNQTRKDRTQIHNSSKQDVWGLPADAPAGAPREWLGPSINEVAEALWQRFKVRATKRHVSRSILDGFMCCGWRFFATPDAASDAKVAKERRRVLAALDALPARE